MYKMLLHLKSTEHTKYIDPLINESIYNFIVRYLNTDLSRINKYISNRIYELCLGLFSTCI